MRKGLAAKRKVTKGINHQSLINFQFSTQASETVEN